MSDGQASPVFAWPDIVLDLVDLVEGEPSVYLVGGAVRDALLRRPIRDVDLIATGGGRRLARRIADAWKGDYYPLDADRDVGRALIDTPNGRILVDVAGLRADDLDADLRDRDFTINAMAVQLSGGLDSLADPLGGLRDLRAKRLRHCSPASITNDPIRAVRAVRISAQFGLRIEPDTLRAVRDGVSLLGRVSPERVRDEFIQLLSLPKPVSALRILRGVGLLSVIVPALAGLRDSAWDQTVLTVERTADLIRTIGPERTDETAAQFALGMVVMALDRYRAQLNDHLLASRSTGRTQKSLLVLASLLATLGPIDAGQVGRKFKLSADECQWLEATLAALPGALELREPDALALHRYWRTAGAAGIDALLLALASTLARQGVALDQDAWVRQLEAARLLLWAWFDRHDTLVEPPPLVTGNQLMTALRLRPGPAVGRLLDQLREAQVTGVITTPDAALELAAELLEQDQAD